MREHRGNSYAYDLLVEATHLLAAEDADRIVLMSEPVIDVRLLSLPRQ